MPELIIYPFVAFIFAFLRYYRSKLFSATVITVCGIYMLYSGLVNIFWEYINIRTMPWPINIEDAILGSRITFVFVFVFWLVSYRIDSTAFQSNFLLTPTPREYYFNRRLIFIWITSILGSLFVLLPSADGWWLFARYPDSKTIWRVIDLEGLGFLAVLLLLIAYYTSFYIGIKRHRFTILVIILFSLHFVLSGDRGSLLFIAFGTLSLKYLHADLFKRKKLVYYTLASAIPVLFFLNELSNMRSWGGGRSIDSFMLFIEDIDLLPQAMAHMYYGSKAGAINGGYFAGNISKFFVIFLMQLLPKGLLLSFGFEPYLGARALHEFAFHRGGFFVPAESFFVGGWPTVVLLAVYFGLLARINDQYLFYILSGPKNVKYSQLPGIAAALATASTLYTLFYGLQAFHRMASLGVIIAFFLWLYRFFFKRS